MTASLPPPPRILSDSAFCFTGDNKDEVVAKALKECLRCVMTCDGEVVRKQLKSLFERLEDNHSNRQDTTPYLGRLFIRIYREFPDDVGCFIIYFLNHVVLEPGEAVYLAPNMPHAYLYGGMYSLIHSFIHSFFYIHILLFNHGSPVNCVFWCTRGRENFKR